MNDREAMQALLDGKKIRLKNLMDEWWLEMPYQTILLKGQDSYFSSNWEIYEEPTPKEKPSDLEKNIEEIRESLKSQATLIAHLHAGMQSLQKDVVFLKATPQFAGGRAAGFKFDHPFRAPNDSI